MSLVALLVPALSVVVATSVTVPCLLCVLLAVPVVVAGFETSMTSLDPGDELDDDELVDDVELFSSLLAAKRRGIQCECVCGLKKNDAYR